MKTILRRHSDDTKLRTLKELDNGAYFLTVGHLFLYLSNGIMRTGLAMEHQSIAIDAKIMTSGDVSYIESYGERSQLCNMGDFCKMFVAGTDTYLLNSGNNCSIISAGKDINISDCGFGTFIASYGDMNAIRRDEELDNLHSVYVDQWDWEKVIREEDRNEAYLKNVVRLIGEAADNVISLFFSVCERAAVA